MAAMLIHQFSNQRMVYQIPRDHSITLPPHTITLAKRLTIITDVTATTCTINSRYWNIFIAVHSYKCPYMNAKHTYNVQGNIRFSCPWRFRVLHGSVSHTYVHTCLHKQGACINTHLQMPLAEMKLKCDWTTYVTAFCTLLVQEMIGNLQTIVSRGWISWQSGNRLAPY